MIITGSRILDAPDMQKERVKTLDAQFKPSLFRFERENEDEKRDPREIIREYEELFAQIL